MIHHLGTAASIIFTGSVVAGIGALIASDFTDLSALFSRKPPSQLQRSVMDNSLGRVSSIHFFKTEKVKGHRFKITTGIRFKTAGDIAKSNTENRWCYTQLGSGKVTRHISLGKQSGKNKSRYTDTTLISEADLRALGVDAAELAGLARKYCHLKTGHNPQASKDKKKYRNWRWKLRSQSRSQITAF